MWSGKRRTIVASCSSVERSREWEVAVESDVYPSLQLVHVGAGRCLWDAARQTAPVLPVNLR